MDAKEIPQNCLTCKNKEKDEFTVLCQVVPVRLPIDSIIRDMECDFYVAEETQKE